MLFSQDSYEAQAHSQVHHHEAKLSHELIAAAASYEAAKGYENHIRASGQLVSHEKAKELFAGFAGGYIDRLFETKGLDAYDKHRAKQEAQNRAEAALRSQAGGYY